MSLFQRSYKRPSNRSRGEYVRANGAYHITTVKLFKIIGENYVFLHEEVNIFIKRNTNSQLQRKRFFL